ncbi:MAG TPA: substrate-binding domain-containing protein [Acidimicrobiales bacterium]|nr:substrate-binding domain-containing protein [Acidimicrobiales bacterium]
MSLVATGLFTGMTATSASATSKVIYVIGYQLNNAFWVTEGKGAGAAGKAFGVTVRYEAPETSSDAGMISLIDAALATHPYGIAIDYTDKTMQAPVLQALGQGTKVVLYNNNRFEAQAGGATTNPAVTNLAYVGQDEHHSGDVLATEFLNFLPKGGTVLIINPFAEAFVLTLRYDGVNSVLKAAGYNTDLLVVNGNDPEASVEATIGAYLQGHKGIVGIVGLGDPGASPATRYVEEHKLNIPVATFDIDTETYDLMKAPGSDEKVALDQQPYLQAYYAVEDLASEMLSGFQPVSVNTGTFLVTASNLDVLSKLVADGED